MAVVCYQVAGFEYAPERGMLALNTFSMAAPRTNIQELLRIVAPSVKPIGHSGDVFDPSYLFTIAETEVGAATGLLRSHLAPAVTAITDCDLSACLDFYRHPLAEDGAVQRWEYTEVGGLIYQAKYRGLLKTAGPKVADLALHYVRGHPLLSTVRAVVAVPSSQAVGAAERGLVAGVAKVIAAGIGAGVDALTRDTVTQYAQKNLPDDANPTENQFLSMRYDGRSDGAILVVDDLMQSGSTVNEATRAIRARGVSRVYSLSLAKEYRGTRGFQFG